MPIVYLSGVMKKALGHMSPQQREERTGFEHHQWPHVVSSPGPGRGQRSKYRMEMEQRRGPWSTLDLELGVQGRERHMARSQEGGIFSPGSVECMYRHGLPHKTPETGAFEQQTLISSEFEGWNSQIRLPAWEVSGEIFLACRRLPPSCVLPCCSGTDRKRMNKK